jgi:hypothetical protein
MKILPVIALAIITLSLYGSVESSIKIPMREHMNYTFVHDKNYQVEQMEEKQYLHSLAPMSENEIKTVLQSKGYEIQELTLRDITSNLVYEAHIMDAVKGCSIVYVDPASGIILESHSL